MVKGKGRMKETELAKKVVNWLRDYKWDVYQEVEIYTTGCIADIVAVQNGLNWIIECKTTMSLSLIRQAYNWFGTANYVSVASPYPYKVGKDQIFVQRVLEQFGIGLLYTDYRGGFDIKERVRPRLNRNVYPKPNTYLKEEHKVWAEAGNAEGKRYTPFQDTCGQILREVKQSSGGLTIKELIGKIKHHYATPESAKVSLLHWGQKGLIKGVMVKRDKNNLRFYLNEHKE